jgi:TniQ
MQGYIRQARRLPITLRPYLEEALGSWIARVAGIYLLSPDALLSEYCGLDGEDLTELDLLPSAPALEFLASLLEIGTDSLRQHTIAGSHPQWLPNWITRHTPAWHTTERRTIFRPGLRLNFCSSCLADDTEAGRDQYIRLDWYCAVTTLCSKHCQMLASCCIPKDLQSPLRSRRSQFSNRLYCHRCDEPLDSRMMRSRRRDQPAELATLMKFEALLRTALSKTGFLFFSGEAFYSKQLLHCVRDLVWALTRAVPGGNDKGVHRDPTCGVSDTGWVPPSLRQLGLVVAWNHRVSSSPPRDDRCDDSFSREQETSDSR